MSDEPSFTDGELLPVVGGPYDGATAPVSILFPFLNGGITNTLLRIDGNWYALDEAKRRWRHVLEVTPAVGA